MGLVTLLIYIVAACIVLWLLFYIVTHLLPAEMQPVGKVIVVCIAVIFLLWLLFSLTGTGGSPIRMRP